MSPPHRGSNKTADAEWRKQTKNSNFKSKNVTNKEIFNATGTNNQKTANLILETQRKKENFSPPHKQREKHLGQTHIKLRNTDILANIRFYTFCKFSGFCRSDA